MIVRMWRAHATIKNADEYVEHATMKVFPTLSAIEGHRGAYLLRRAHGDMVEFVVLTFWESMQAVQKFAGAQPDRAVVEPEARAILASFEEFVAHLEVVYSPSPVDSISVA
jgi:heme-degrading monooxygenase HmoA